jgi:hydroxymethylpyrimidine/phosphomethylpyrimidine kinase
MNFDSSTTVDTAYIIKAVNLLQKEFNIKTVKTGLLPTDSIWLEEFSKLLDDFSVPVIIDPVIKATSDSKDLEIPETYLKLITGKNRVITPNLKELKNIHLLAFGHEDKTEKMALNISEKFGCTVLTTFEGEKNAILLAEKGSTEEIAIEIFNSDNSYHGTGCAFSSALASYLGQGLTLNEAVSRSSVYIYEKVRKSIWFNSKGQHFLY